MNKLLRISIIFCSCLLFHIASMMAQENVIYPESYDYAPNNWVVNSTNNKLYCAGYLPDDWMLSIFANGNPVRVYEQDSKLYIATEDGADVFGFSNTTSINETKFYAVRLYGGSYESDVTENTSITLESGAILNIFGGGRSDDSGKTANVGGTANIVVTGGSASLICGGGRRYAKTNEVSIKIGSAASLYNGSIGEIMSGGMDEYQTTNKGYDGSLETNVNGVNKANMFIFGGTYGVICCGGGNGYTHTGNSNVDIAGAKIDKLYGVYEDGTAESVNAHIQSTTINTELASVNKGNLKIGSFIIINSTSFGPDAKAYVGATPNSDVESTAEVSGNISYSFPNSKGAEILLGEGITTDLITVTGATVKVSNDGQCLSLINVEWINTISLRLVE